MVKKPRGSIECSQIKDYGIVVTKWTDNNCVTVASTAFGKEPITKANRFCRRTRTRISIDKPTSVDYYNKNMGGVDRMDQNISYYRIGK